MFYGGGFYFFVFPTLCTDNGIPQRNQTFTEAVQLHWTAPKSYGGTPITSYEISRDGSTWTDVGEWPKEHSFFVYFIENFELVSPKYISEETDEGRGCEYLAQITAEQALYDIRPCSSDSQRALRAEISLRLFCLPHADVFKTST